jgi:hypothetical protein
MAVFPSRVVFRSENRKHYNSSDVMDRVSILIHGHITTLEIQIQVAISKSQE